jgi:hypothetical protein
MKDRSLQQQGMYILSIFFAIAPFALGLIRAFQTGWDLRILLVAFASLLGALVVRVIAKTRSRNQNSVLMLSVLTFTLSALFAGLTAYLLGATAAAGVWGVAFVLAFCWTASFVLYSYSLPRPT